MDVRGQVVARLSNSSDQVATDAQRALFSAFRNLGLNDLPCRIEDVPAWLLATSEAHGSLFAALWVSFRGEGAGPDDVVALIGRAVAELSTLLILH